MGYSIWNMVYSINKSMICIQYLLLALTYTLYIWQDFYPNQILSNKAIHAELQIHSVGSWITVSVLYSHLQLIGGRPTCIGPFMWTNNVNAIHFVKGTHQTIEPVTSFGLVYDPDVVPPPQLLFPSLGKYLNYTNTHTMHHRVPCRLLLFSTYISFLV